LLALLSDAGFKDLKLTGVGRFPYLWMTMVVKALRLT
jgi:hypothetical protein